MKKQFKSYLTLALAGSLLAFTSCDDHDHEPHDHEGELITTLRLTMTPANPADGPVVVATFSDPDGDGGQPAVYTPSEVMLKAGITYNTTIAVLDESHNGEDLTAEIREKGDEHQFFFVPNPATLVTVTPTDRDRNNRPIGLTSTLATSSSPQSGSLRVVLKHQAGGLKNDNSNINTGETDVEANFSIRLTQ